MVVAGEETSERDDAEGFLRVAAIDPHERCRPPAEDGPPWERRLARANRHATEQARRRATAAFAGLDLLIDARWGDRPGVHPAPPAFAPEAALPWLDEVLAGHHLPPERLLVAGTTATPFDVTDLGFGVARPPATATADVVAAGGAVVVRAVEVGHPALTDLLADLDRLTGQPARVDAGLVGTGTGWEAGADDVARAVAPLDHEVLVTTVVPPGPGAGERLELPTQHRVGPGEVVTVPAGRSTTVVGADRPAAVLVVAVPRLSAYALSRALVADAVYWPALRADVPVDRRHPHDSYAGSVFDRPDGLAQAVQDALAGPAMAEGVVARFRAAVPPRPRASLLASIAVGIREPAADARLRSIVTGGFAVAERAGEAGAHLVAGGRRIDADPASALALAIVADGEVHRLDDLAEAVPEGYGTDWCRDAATGLLSTGLVELVS